MNLVGQNIVVFDLEIKNPIGNDTGIGWRDYARMGISVGVSFDFRTNDYMVYMDDNLPLLAERLAEADLVVGFNIKQFDLPLLSKCPETKLREELAGCEGILRCKTYDILYYSRLAVGSVGRGFPKGLKLDNHLIGTFGADQVKTEDGAEAPHMYQRGEYGRLISYCVADVKREAKLFKHIWESGSVTTDTHGFKMLIPPQNVLEQGEITQ